MSIEIKMPALSPTMEKGTLSKWLVKEGDTIASGDVIAEIETDKATMEVETADEGTIGKLIVAAGTEDVPVGEVIAIVLEEGESEVAAPKKADKKAEPSKTVTEEKAPDKKTAEKSAPEKITSAKASTDTDDRVLISPLARRLAKQTGLDVSTIQGSGPGGRIVKRDLDGAKPASKTDSQKTASSPVSQAALQAAPITSDIPFEEVKLSAMRKVIAARLSESKQTIPHFYLTVDVRMDKLLAMRKEINDGEGVKLSVNDFIIKALAVALRQTPDANVQFAGDKLLKFKRVDISVAVAIDGGLVTPVIRDAGARGLGSISDDMKQLAEKAKAGKLAPEEYKGGSISLSNLGMYGIKQFDAVINPPQAAILAVGGAEQRPVVTNGEIGIATVMEATLSCDHRAIDGAVGADLLRAFKTIMENPLKLLL